MWSVQEAEADIYNTIQKRLPRLFTNGRVMPTFASQGWDDGDDSVMETRAHYNDLIGWDSESTPRCGHASDGIFDLQSPSKP